MQMEIEIKQEVVDTEECRQSFISDVLSIKQEDLCNKIIQNDAKDHNYQHKVIICDEIKIEEFDVNTAMLDREQEFTDVMSGGKESATAQYGRKKQRPYSEYERQLVMQLVQSKIGILQNRKTDGVSQKRKADAWEDITCQFNNFPNITQTAEIKQLKKMWQNLKTKTRDSKNLEIQRKGTDSGPAPIEMQPSRTPGLLRTASVIPTTHTLVDNNSVAIANGKENHDDYSIFYQSKVRCEPNIAIELPSEENQMERIIHKEAVSGTLSQPDLLLDQNHRTRPRSAVRLCHSRVKKKISFDDLKKELLWQELENNKRQFELEIEHIKRKYILEIDILELKKELLKKEIKINNLK